MHRLMRRWWMRRLIPYCAPLVLFFAGPARVAPLHAQPRSPEFTTVSFVATEQAFEPNIEAADALIWHIFSSVDAQTYAAGVEAYFWLINQADSISTETERSLWLKHMRALAIVMPAALRGSIGLGESGDKDITDHLVAGYGRVVEKWWRRSDNLPATEANERLEEHLRRVIFAHNNFPNARDLRGFDDRGEIYIRLGDPYKKTAIKLLAPNLQVNAHNFILPDNEFWVYSHVDDEAQFLFIQKTKSRGFKLSTSSELIPSRLKNGRRHTADLLQWMEEVYGQLMLYHTAYGSRFDDLNNYLMLPTDTRADVFARSQLAQASTLDDQIEYQRSIRVPDVYSNNFGIAANLDVDVRWARFLNTDGSTRTEIFWGLDRAAMKPSRRLVRNFYKQGHEPSEQYLISSATSLLNADYEVESISQKHFLTPVESEEDIPARSVVVANDPAGSHIAMQWDQQWVVEDDAARKLPGARIKMGTFRIDSLQALHGEGRVLEMSDLKPLRTAPDMLLETAVPYPAQKLDAGTPLALYFEVYNLTFGADDLVHYEIEYEVARRQNNRLFRLRSSRETTGASTTYTSSSRTVKEFIVPDLLDLDASGSLEIIVHVTDLTSGAEISRTIGFDRVSG